jgi:hypothetical protein
VTIIGIAFCAGELEMKNYSVGTWITILIFTMLGCFLCVAGSLGFGLFRQGFQPPGGGGNAAPPLNEGIASPTPTRQASGSSTEPAKTPTPATRFELSFDSTITDLLGKEHVRARVLLTDSGSAGTLAGEAPLEIVQADGDNTSGGACQDNNFVEQPGNFTVVSALLTFKPKASASQKDELQDVVLVYSLNPEKKCLADGNHGPNNWNLFWMVYNGHFQHTDDQLDDSGPEPLITAQKWDVLGLTARKSYQWKDGHTGIRESTVIQINPVQP